MEGIGVEGRVAECCRGKRCEGEEEGEVIVTASAGRGGVKI